MTRDHCTLIYLLNLELREEMFEPGHGMGWNPASAIGEQQLRQSGSSSRSGCDREQQLKQTQAASSSWSGRNRGVAAGSGGKRGAAAEADASGEQQLKRAQSGSSSWKRRQTGSSS